MLVPRGRLPLLTPAPGDPRGHRRNGAHGHERGPPGATPEGQVAAEQFSGEHGADHRDADPAREECGGGHEADDERMDVPPPGQP
jgi:hypothetical protein